jgi:aminoglycoside phosphotransferase (APT) family kinase protein
MVGAWSAEIAVSMSLARSLIEEHFPALAPARLESLGEGWDNTAFRVNDAYVFRFPRRQVAVSCLEAEVRLLPLFAPRLPLPVPIPNLVGRPTEAYAWPFAGHRMIPGRTACTAGLDDDERTAIATPLGQFLSVLHAISPHEADRHGAGPDTIRRLDLSFRIPKARETLQTLVHKCLITDIHPFMAILDAAHTDYLPRADTLVHGDLYFRHLLVSPEHQLAGVIDWGDIHLGDPAVDLAIAHTFLPPSAHAAFRSAYGPIAEVTWYTARLRGLWHTLLVQSYGDEISDADLLRETRRALGYLVKA